MTRVGFLAFACLFVLCGTLFAGLAPFRGPINAVSWSQDHKGLVFGDYGTIESPDSFVSTDPANRASSSLEIWMQPGLTIDSNTFLPFQRLRIRFSSLCISINPRWFWTAAQKETKARSLESGSTEFFAKFGQFSLPLPRIPIKRPFMSTENSRRFSLASLCKTIFLASSFTALPLP